MSKRVAIYTRVSTVDQHPETQLYDMRSLATQRGFEVVQEYTDKTAPRSCVIGHEAFRYRRWPKRTESRAQWSAR